MIWLVQRTHYPSYRYIAADKFTEFEKFHCSSIGIIVIPLMLCEVATSAWLLFLGIRSAAFLLSLGFLALVWLSTFAIQVPLHTKLERSFDAQAVERLISSNWIRTIGWSARVFCLLTMFPLGPSFC